MQQPGWMEALGKHSWKVEKAQLILHRNDSPEETDGRFHAETTRAVLAKGVQALSEQTQPRGQQMFQVEYNPNSLSIKGSAPQVENTTLANPVQSAVPQQRTGTPAIRLEVELVLDASHIPDGLETLQNGLSTGMAHRAQTEEDRVVTATNALLAVMLCTNVTGVTFRWGTMSFKGQIDGVHAVYTLFSAKGKPLRSQITLSIQQELRGKADWQQVAQQQKDWTQQRG